MPRLQSFSLRRRFPITLFSLVLFSLGLFMTDTADAQKFTGDPEDMLIMQLATGTVKIQLFPDLAPKHVERIKTLTRQGFYDGLTFHRVIEGFMAQTGDPKGDGTGGSSLPDLPAEFSGVAFSRGILGAARTQDPNSANSQFFIVFQDAPWLNNQYTAFGVVTDGMEHVDRIKRGDPDRGGRVLDPDKIISLRVAADVES